MLPFFAQTPPPEAVTSWLSVAAYLSVTLTSILVAVKHFTGSSEKREITNSPLEVKAHAGSVSRDELKQVHGRIERERSEINDAIAQVRSDAERRSDKLDLKLEENTKMTSEMRGEVKHMNQAITGLSSSITNFLQNQAKK